MSPNYIDILLALVILLSVWSGWRRGFIIGRLELIAWAATLAAAFLFYPYTGKILGRYISSPGPWMLPLAFLLTFVAVRLICAVVINGIIRCVSPSAHSHFANKFLGIIPGIFKGIIWADVLAALLLALPLSEEISRQGRDSRLAVRLTDGMEKCEEKISPVLDPLIRQSLGRTMVEPESEKLIPLHYTVPAPVPRPDLEARMLVLVNEERAKQG